MRKSMKWIFIVLFLVAPGLLLAQHTVFTPSIVKGAPGDTIIVPLNLAFGQSPPNPPLDAFGCKLEFPHHLLAFDTTEKVGTLTANWMLAQGQLFADSLINIGGFNITPITASGLLLKLKFIVRANATGKDSLKLSGFVDDLAGATTIPGIFAIPSPPTVGDIPDLTIQEGEQFPQINLDDYVTDAEDPDSTMSWCFTGNSEIKVTIADRVATLQTPHSDWNGSETIRFRATDPDSLWAEDSATFTVLAVNDTPRVLDIPNMKINEGEQFPPIQLDDYVDDVDDADAAITWTFTGNIDLQVTIHNRVATVAAPNPDWFGKETIVFIATDPGGLSDSDPAVFTVVAVNDTPRVADIPDQTIVEGGAFAPIHLDHFVADPDDPDSTITWSLSGNKELDVTILNRIATINAPHPNWSGTETITFTATDPRGLSDSDAATFTVTAANDTPMVSDIPNQTILEGEAFNPIHLDDFVSDPDNADSELIWTWTGNQELRVDFNNRVATIRAPHPDWFGVETIAFIATDPGGLADSDDAVFTILAVNDTPKVAAIPDQAISEGESFDPIHLDDYVADPDDPDSLIAWTFSGNQELLVEISNRIARVQAPDPQWYGQEAVVFIATDPGGLSAQDTVRFQVQFKNDPPTISSIPDTSFWEDDSLHISFSYITQFVHDPDNSLLELIWSFSGQQLITITTDLLKNLVTFSAPPDWSGSENIVLAVTDPFGAADSDTIQVTVYPVPDPPAEFSLIAPVANLVLIAKPETMEFVWQESENVDPGDHITYSFYFGSDSTFQASSTFKAEALSDTVYQFIWPAEWNDGEYFWAARAADTDGLARWSQSKLKLELKTFANGADMGSIPTIFSLSQNYPNPFNPKTCIEFQVPKTAQVTIKIYNLLGQEIKTLVDGLTKPGNYTIHWDGTHTNGQNVGSGIYLYTMYANGFTFTRKMIRIE